jgi:hypothetical protein
VYIYYVEFKGAKMDAWALFSNRTAEKIIISSIPHKKDESGLIFRSTISSMELRKSVQRSITNTYHFLLTKFPDNAVLLEPVSICILGFSGGKVIGQSAELAFAAAFISFLVERKILNTEKELPHIIAATGTINDRFEVGSVSGLKEKILAAHEIGAKMVLYPASNLNDVEGLLKEEGHMHSGIKDMELLPVATLEDLFKLFGLVEVTDNIPAYNRNDCELTDHVPDEGVRGKVRNREYKRFKGPLLKKMLLGAGCILTVLIALLLFVLSRNNNEVSLYTHYTPAYHSELFPAHTPATDSLMNNTVLPVLTSAAAVTPTLAVTPVPTYTSNTPVSTPVIIQPTVTTAVLSVGKILLFNDGNVKGLRVKNDGKSVVKLSEDQMGYSGKAVRIEYNLCEGGFVSAVCNLKGLQLDNTASVKRKKIIFYYKGSNDNAPNSMELKLSCFNSGSRTFYFTMNNSTKVEGKWIKKEIDYDEFNPRLNEDDIENLEKIEFCIFNDPKYGDKAGDGKISICDMEIS